MAEVRFVRAARQKGLLVTKSSHTEDIHEHIDYWLAMSGQGQKWGVDVKGNNLPDEIWVEFKNVGGTQAGYTEALLSSLSICQRKVGFPL